MKLTLRYFIPGLKAGFRILYSFFSFLKKGKTHPEKTPLEVRYKKCRNLAFYIAKVLKADFIIEGKEYLPKDNDEPIFIVPNHLSNFDPFSLYVLFEKPTAFVGKKEISDMPFAPDFLLSTDGLLMDREDIKGSLRVLKSIEDDFLLKKHNWVIFPEGTRNKDFLANLNSFHHGSFRPALKTGTLIYPVATYGTFRVLKNWPHYKKYPVYLKILPPIDPKKYPDLTTADLANMAQDMIQKTITYDLRIRDHEYMVKNNKKKFLKTNLKY